MKHFSLPRQIRRGGLMGVALLMMLAGGMFLSAWVSLMSVRATQLSFWEQAVERRLSLEGARLAARQVAWEHAFQPNASLSANTSGLVSGFLTSTLGVGVHSNDGWSGIDVLASSASPDSLTTVYPYNASGLHPEGTYITTEKLVRPSALTSLDPFNAYLFLKSQPPPLAGDLFVAYRKPQAATSELDIHTDNPGHHALWRVEGRAVIRHPLSLFARSTPSPLRLPFQSESIYIQSHDPDNFRPVYGTSLSGGGLAPSNASVVPSTTAGNAANADERFNGYLDVVRNDSNPSNSLWHFMDREQAAGRSGFASIEVFETVGAAGDPYWIEEQSDPEYPPPNWPSGYPPKLRVLYIQLNHGNLPHIRMLGVVDQVILLGQTSVSSFENASALSPVMVAMAPNGATGPSIRDIRLVGDNNRRLVLGVKNWNAAPLDLTWEGSPTSGFEHKWRCVFINEFHSVMVNLPSNITRTVRWLGGVMTDWTFKRRASGGRNPSRLVFVRDSDPSVPSSTPAGPAFASLIPRDAWLESYFIPTSAP